MCGKGNMLVNFFVFCLCIQLITFAHAEEPELYRVSVNSDGLQGNLESLEGSVSADERYIAFTSFSSNLVDDDTNNRSDVFVHDRKTGETVRISVNTDGSQGNNQSDSPAISSNGRFVAFRSCASNFTSDDTNGNWDIFVRDLQTDQLTMVSVDAEGNEGDSYSKSPSISSDGQIVVFESHASNLVTDDTNDYWDFFVHDLKTKQTRRITVNSDGAAANDQSEDLTLSANGQYAVFSSWATNLVENDTNGVRDVFVHNLQTGKVTRVSVSNDDSEGNDWSDWPAISADGRFVAFSSAASNLVEDDTNGLPDIFLHDRQTKTTVRVSTNRDGEQAEGEGSYKPETGISGDGRYVIFVSNSGNLVADDPNETQQDIFIKDMLTGEVERFNFDNRIPYHWKPMYDSMSLSGDSLVFSSEAEYLVEGDTNHQEDVFFYKITRTIEPPEPFDPVYVPAIQLLLLSKP